MKTPDKTRVLVIGGGIVGLACALRLSEAGLRVTVLDRDRPDGVASFGNAGHVATEQIYPLASPETLVEGLGYLFRQDAPLGIRPAYLPRLLPWLARFAWAARPSAFRRGIRALAALQADALHDLRDLLDLAEASHLLRETGHILVSDLPPGSGVRRGIDRQRADGIPIDDIPAQSLDTLALDGGIPPLSAWHYPETAHVKSPSVVLDHLGTAIRKRGGRFVVDTVSTLDRRDGALRAVGLSGREYTADRIVLAAGPGSRLLLEPHGVSVPLETEGGYHIHLPNWRLPVDRPVIDARRRIILTPMQDGVRVSGFVEFGGWECRPDPKRFALLERHLRSLAPHADTTGLRRWHGFRPSLPDHLPMIGPLPGAPELVCAFGHQHLGLTLSGVTAKRVEDIVLNRASQMDLAPFRPERFGLDRGYNGIR